MCAEKYNETLEFLFNALPVWERVADGAAYKPGTERVEEFARAVGSPHRRLLTVHIAGTNGKGSTASMLAALLQSAGLRVGLYTSPHLVDFRERIRVDGAMIPEGAVVEFAEKYRAEMVRLGMTFFEMATVMAFWFFERSEVDVAVIETGLGGRHDATNIITPLVSVITNIGLEHTKYLGSTLAAIASEKAGIIKPGVPVVIGERDPATAPVFLAEAAAQGSEIVFADTFHSSLRASPSRLGHSSELDGPRLVVGSPSTFHFSLFTFHLDLSGVYQQKNARTVLAAVDVLRKNFSISDAAVRAGLRNTAKLTGLRGRWEVLGERPKIVVDTAHNAHGFRQIARQLALWRADNPAGRIWMVLGFAADKDVAAIAATLPPDAHLILTAADSPRALPVGELAAKLADRAADRAVETAATVRRAVARALAQASEADLIYIGGSNFVVGEFLTSC